MSDLVLVSTHDLRRSGALRTAFRALGYAVDLVTPSETLDAAQKPVLLVLSAGAGASASAALVTQARDAGTPVIGYLASDDVAATTPEGITEAVSSQLSPDDAAALGHRLLERRRLQLMTGIVGETEGMREILERVIQIAPVDSTVLVTGESGTGKELVARGIHGLSPRRHKPFIAVNVAALPDTLLESELFGHEKGAFTGAIDSRRGFFELAHGGTIFLDEIGEMPLATQTKLLRVLEQREFLRVGGEKPIRVDVRIIAATNQDLRQLVTIGEFRKDLYYRINVLSIVLPPLRERPEDVPRLVDAFIRDASEHHNRPFRGISPEAMRILEAHYWPGNVRELKNLVESMVVLAPKRQIQPNDIPPDVRSVDRSRALVLAQPARAMSQANGQLRPELEFVFRTLVELRVDMDQLRREFEAYRTTLGEGVRPMPSLGGGGLSFWPAGEEVRGREITHHANVVDVEPTDTSRPASPRGELMGSLGSRSAPETPEEGVVVYRPGMTIDDMEKEAIRAALEEVRGNRRKAAERLGIGERTLYRKIQRFGLE